MNTTDTDFAHDEHDLYGKLSYVLPPTRFPYVCIMGQTSIYARNIKKQMAGREPSVGEGGEVVMIPTSHAPHMDSSLGLE